VGRGAAEPEAGRREVGRQAPALSLSKGQNY
jgi:hypothetical protein